MREETQWVLERLLVLLSTQPPHLATACKQLDDLLKKPSCVAETDIARKTAVRLLERLAAPALENDPEMRVVAEELRERLLTAGTLAGARIPLEKAAAWLSASQTGERAGEGIPVLLSERLLTVLRLYGESDAALAEEADRLLNGERRPNPWPGIDILLRDITAQSATSASSHRVLEGQALGIALRNGLRALQATQPPPSAPAEQNDQGEGPEEEARLLRALTSHLRLRGKALRQRARSLAGRVADSKELAERLRGRLRQLEEALSQARTDGFLDPVTGLPDRFAFTAQLKRHLERAVHLQESFSLALMHFHDFAPTVAALGREGEVRLVEGMVQEIRRHLREEEYLARLSVERFVILFPRSDANRAENAARELEQMLVQTQFALDDRMIHLEAYCGTVALGPQMSGQEMLEMTERVAAASRREAINRGPLLVPLRTCTC
ncbi:MAG: diguanylate cyclase [Magnetococcales bacterium]|nr:diguanylate cyclase [Magnetococcales bacterium]